MDLVLQYNSRYNPEPANALITGIPIGYAEFATKINAETVNPCIEFINQEFVDDAHSRGLKVLVYTVNDLDDIDRMTALGVDGLFCNFPDRLLK